MHTCSLFHLYGFSRQLSWNTIELQGVTFSKLITLLLHMQDLCHIMLIYID